MLAWTNKYSKVPIEETVIVPKTGLYKVWISNSRAWLYSLTVKYKFEIVKTKTNLTEF